MEEQKFVQIEGVTVITAAANPSATTSELNIESNNTSSGDCMHIDSGSDMQQQQYQQPAEMAQQVPAAGLSNTIFYYHSCSVAKKIKKIPSDKYQKKKQQKYAADELSLYLEGKKTPALKKFEVYVIYSSNKSSKVRVRKVKFGYYGEIDRDTCESERFQHMREQYKKLLIDSEDFSHDVFVETGAFFNPKFWDINVQWLKCSAQRQEEYIQQIDDFLVAKYSAKAYDLHNNNKV